MSKWALLFYTFTITSSSQDSPVTLGGTGQTHRLSQMTPLSAAHAPSMMVPAPADSVSPYPCPTGQQKQMFMNRWVAAESGAPPQSRMRSFPPSSIRTFRKIRLKCKDKIMHLLLKNKMRVPNFVSELKVSNIFKRTSMALSENCDVAH